MNFSNATLTTIAFCWQIERRDGAGLALTSHDQPLDIAGVRFEPAPGIVPAAIRAEQGLEPASSEVLGWMSSAAISEADIQAGLWDGATVRLMAVDWEQPEGEPHTLLEGELGQVSSNEGRFEADLVGVASKLAKPVCPATSPECRAELGDRMCRVDMAGRRLRARIVSVAHHVILIDQEVDDRFRFGQLRVLGGSANGQRRRILSIDGRTLKLRNAPVGTVVADTAVELVEGCDKRLESCMSRFANAVNFRGEPHLPGNDLLTRYPGA